MANHALPTLTSTYTNFVTEVGGRIDDAVRQNRSDTVTLTNPPVGTIRWNTTNARWEANTGTVGAPVWTALAATYGISISGDAGSVDGKSFGTFSAAGGILYATSTTDAAATAAGTAGTVLTSGGAGAPTWTAQSSLNAGQVDGKDFGTFSAAGGILYATSTTAASGTAAGTAGQVLTSAGAGAPTWTSQSSLSVGSATTATSATSATSATTATNIAGGANGSVPYQTAAGATAMLAAGTSGSVLTTNGAAAPTWTAQSSLNAGQVDGKDFGTFTAAGGILYATSTTAASGTAAGTSGQALLSGGAAAPTWGTLGIGAGGTNATTAAQAKINLEVITAATGSARLPVGTTAERDASPAAGFIRFNSTVGKFEGHTGSGWSSVGGGATGGGADEVFIENGQNVTANYTIPTGRNAMTTGPITVANGVSVTVSSGSRWVIL